MAQNPDTPNENDRMDGIGVQKPSRGRRLRVAFKRHPLLGALIACSVLLVVAVVAWMHLWNSGLPSTKHEAVMGIVAKLSAADRRLLAQTRRDNLGMFHMGWGMGIRNGLGLWGKNKRLMRDISGGEPMHTDNMSGIVMVAVWDELHKGEQIPNFDVSDPSKFFRQIDTFLRDAKAKNESTLLVHTPVWVLKDRSPYMVDELTHAIPQIVEEAKRIIAHKEPLTYLALQYLTEVERAGTIFKEIEPLLDDMTVVPLPKRVRSQAENQVAPPTYSWEPTTVSQIAAIALGDLYHVRFESADSYRSWRAAVDVDPVLRWKYRPIISDDDLAGLMADRVTFARILCLSRRWIDFEGGGHFELEITKDGLDLLTRLSGTKVDYAYEQREAMAHQLLQVVLAGIPIDQLVAAMRIDPSFPPPKWIEDREKYNQDYFGAAVIQVKRDALVGHSNKAAVWDLLEQHRREAKVWWPYKEYLCRLMFAVDFERTDTLAKELLISVPVPKDENDLSEREQMLIAILKDQFPTYRQMIKDLYFVAWPQKLNGASDLTGTINLYIIREGEEKQRLWEEIQSDPRYASVASRH